MNTHLRYSTGDGDMLDRIACWNLTKPPLIPPPLKTKQQNMEAEDDASQGDQ